MRAHALILRAPAFLRRRGGHAGTGRAAASPPPARVASSPVEPRSDAAFWLALDDAWQRRRGM